MAKIRRSVKNFLKSVIRFFFPNYLLWRLRLRRRRCIRENSVLSTDELLLLAEKQRPPRKNGLELIGFLTHELGIGQSARLTAKCLDAVPELPWEGYNFTVGIASRSGDHTLDGRLSNRICYNVSLLCINAAELHMALTHLPLPVLGTYRIGMWYWELEDFPAMWDPAFALVDELWAPTHFIESCLKKKASCPVVYMPNCIAMDPPPAEPDRKHFSLPEDAFLFLSMYDHFSSAQRKNPTGAIRAFQQAFSPEDRSVGLVLKVNNIKPDSEEIRALKELCGEYKNIYFIVGTLSRPEVNALLKACDAAVSLHRSEGLGLLCQEAMLLGKPVIATAWSGNMDFTREDNSCLVGYDLVTLEEEIGPYPKGGRWAEPHIEEAAAYMARLTQEKAYYRRIAAAGQRTMEEEYSPAVCGQRMAARLQQIFQNLENKKK